MKKSTVQQKLDKLLQEASETYPIAPDWAYTLSLWQGVYKYYSNTKDVSESFTALIEGMYSYAQRERIVMSEDESLGITHDYSTPDFGDVFYKWEWLDKPLVVAIDVDELGESVVAEEQPYIDAIIAEINSARADEAARIDADKESYWAGKDNLKRLTEDRGSVIATPKKEEIVKLIYIDAGAKQIIEDNGLDVYIPRAVR